MSEQMSPGRQLDPWAGFAPGEDREIHDPVQARFDVWRGKFWVQIRIGTWWVVLVQATCLALFVGTLLWRWEPAVLILVPFLTLVIFTFAVDQMTPGWAEDHNARVRRAQDLERAMTARDRSRGGS